MTTDFPDFETEDDPLAAFSLDLPAEITAVQERADGVDSLKSEMASRGYAVHDLTPEMAATTNRISQFLEKPSQGEPLYLDFETLPDFDRMYLFDLEPLPKMPEVDGPDALMGAEEFISQAIPEVAGWLAKHNPPADWVAGIRAAEQSSKKPRKGLFDALDDHTKRIASIASAEADRVKMLSVNPLYCRICCVSFAVGDSAPVSIYAPDRMMEKHLVEQVWRMLGRHTPVIGYGLSFFDIPVLLARSMILGVHPTRFLDRRKYGSRDILDLCKSLFEDQRAFGLGKVCKSLGILSALPDVDGSHVYEMWKAGNVQGIRDYCEDDVKLTQKLHKSLAGYFCV